MENDETFALAKASRSRTKLTNASVLEVGDSSSSADNTGEMTTDMPDWEIREEMWIMFNKELSEQSPSV
jgi:hypothetical protein